MNDHPGRSSGALGRHFPHTCRMLGTGNLRIVRDGRGYAPLVSCLGAAFSRRPDILQSERQCCVCGHMDWADVPVVSYEEAGVGREELKELVIYEQIGMAIINDNTKEAK